MNELFQRGTIIANRFEIHDLLGRGGMGVVYRVFDRTTRLPRALKTFQTEHIPYATARRIFFNEMQALLNLGEHPCIVGVRWMEEHGGMPFIVTDLIAADARGRVTLTDHIRSAGGPMALERVLNWGVQFCHAMEFCLAHGVAAHRDVKPDNILMQQGALVKVADFGIARAMRAMWQAADNGEPQPDTADRASARTLQLHGGGTPGYLAPEVYGGEPGDERADIYAFGQILWQMGTGIPWSPFLDPSSPGDDLATIARRQLAEQLPQQPTALLAPGLRPIVERCVRADPDHRFAQFTHLRTALETALETETGQRIRINIPEVVPQVYWVDKGASLHAVGREEEAMVCYDRAMRDGPVPEALINKSVSLLALQRASEAIESCDQALALKPDWARAWDIKGHGLRAQGEREAAAACHQRAIDCDSAYAPAWASLASLRLEQGRISAALAAAEQALTLDANLVSALGMRAEALAEISQLIPAIEAFDKAIEMHPYKASLWANRAEALRRAGHLRDAMASVERALALNVDGAEISIVKGNCFRDMGRDSEALECFEQALALNPGLPSALFSKASVLDELGEPDSAAAVWARFVRAAESDPLFNRPEEMTYARTRLQRA